MHAECWLKRLRFEWQQAKSPATRAIIESVADAVKKEMSEA